MSTYRYNFLFVNTTTLLLATGYFCSLEFLYQSEQTILLGFFWLLFFIALLAKIAFNKKYLHYFFSGMGLFIASILFMISAIFSSTQVIDRFFIPSKLTVYYLQEEDSWGNVFIYAEKYGLASENTIKRECGKNAGRLLYVDYDGKISNCGDVKVRTY